MTHRSQGGPARKPVRGSGSALEPCSLPNPRPVSVIPPTQEGSTTHVTHVNQPTVPEPQGLPFVPEPSLTPGSLFPLAQLPVRLTGSRFPLIAAAMPSPEFAKMSLFPDFWRWRHPSIRLGDNASCTDRIADARRTVHSPWQGQQSRPWQGRPGSPSRCEGCRDPPAPFGAGQR